MKGFGVMSKSEKEKLDIAYKKYGCLSAAYLQRKLNVSYTYAIKLIIEFNSDIEQSKILSGWADNQRYVGLN